MRWLLGLLLNFLCIKACAGTVCRSGSQAVFFTENENAVGFERGSHCFDLCSTINCTGVVLNEDSCTALNIVDVYGTIDHKAFLMKHCIEGAPSGSVVKVYNGKFLDGGSEMLTRAASKEQCLSFCYTHKKFACQSILYFADSGDCLLNNGTSAMAAVLKNEDNFDVSYMELQYYSKKVQCSHAFHLIPWDQFNVRGEARLINMTGGPQRCLSLCEQCDYAVYNEYYSECLLVIYDSKGQKLDFIDDRYQVFESICERPTNKCSPRNAMYISYLGESPAKRGQCLQKCLLEPSCKFVYWENDKCLLSTNQLQLPKVIEKICTVTEEQDIAVLFEEANGCPELVRGNLAIDAIELKDCMQLCLTHPTKSCDAIKHYPNGKCQLLDAGAVMESDTKLSNDCQYFKLNVVAFKKGGVLKKNMGVLSPKKEGVKLSKSRGMKVKLHAAPNRVKIRKEPFASDAIDLDVQTICNYDGIVIKVQSPVSIEGEVFARNAHENCSTAMKGTMAQLRMPFTSQRCAITRQGLLYENVIVVKQNRLSETTVITEFDKLYRVTCDYNNHSTIMSATSILQVKDASTTSLQPSGKVPYTSLKMMLRSRRRNDVKTVILGQRVDLKIDDDENIGGNYTLRRCVAHDWQDRENISLVEDGCVTRAAREYIVRGAIRRESNGLLIPLRAFRFRNSERVKIVCQLELCNNCAPAICKKSARVRRFLSNKNRFNDSSESEVQISFIVKNESPEDTCSFDLMTTRDPSFFVPKDGANLYCLSRSSLISMSSAGSLTLIIQFLFLLKLFRYRRKQS